MNPFSSKSEQVICAVSSVLSIGITFCSGSTPLHQLKRPEKKLGKKNTALQVHPELKLEFFGLSEPSDC